MRIPARKELFRQIVARTLERPQSRQCAQKANDEPGKTSPNGEGCSANRSTDGGAHDQYNEWDHAADCRHDGYPRGGHVVRAGLGMRPGTDDRF
jgi:hypothetical protein